MLGMPLTCCRPLATAMLFLAGRRRFCCWRPRLGAAIADVVRPAAPPAMTAPGLLAGDNCVSAPEAREYPAWCHPAGNGGIILRWTESFAGPTGAPKAAAGGDGLRH